VQDFVLLFSVQRLEKRRRKAGIVAVARKLLIALWRWVTAGVEPEGAIFKAA
jgi:transposase